MRLKSDPALAGRCCNCPYRVKDVQVSHHRPEKGSKSRENPRAGESVKGAYKGRHPVRVMPSNRCRSKTAPHPPHRKIYGVLPGKTGGAPS